MVQHGWRGTVGRIGNPSYDLRRPLPFFSCWTWHSVFLLLGEDDLLGVVRVEHHGQDPSLVLVAGVLRDAVQAADRLVEGVPGLEHLGFVVVDGPLVLAL